jgi:hypothetical protein
MPTLDESEDRPEPLGDEETIETTITVGETALTLSVPADANPTQAAAIVSAIGAHVTDRQRAAATAGAAAERVERADEWTLAARLGRFGKRRFPTDVERGDEWKAAARARY